VTKSKIRSAFELVSIVKRYRNNTIMDTVILDCYKTVFKITVTPGLLLQAKGGYRTDEPTLHIVYNKRYHNKLPV